MGPPSACLFDLDGLLLDTEPLHAQAWCEAAAHFGRQLSAAEVRELRGRRRTDCGQLVRSWIAAATGTPPSLEALLAVRQPIAETLLDSAPPMPGAPELLRRCHDLGIPMALATSSSRAAVDRKASPHPWLELIRERVHGDDPELGAGKPAPDPFLLAARRLGVEPSACWAFEDSRAGVRAALAAGCRVHVLLAADMGPEDFPGDVTLLTHLDQVRLPGAAGSAAGGQ
jgi:HAD superfamily hydrolase (TIGR01509 family)